MLEKIVKPVVRKCTEMALAGGLLYGSGCATYKTVSPSLIPSVTLAFHPPTLIKNSRDYNALNWQEAIDYVQTPEQVQDYLENHFRYDDNESGLAVVGLFSIGGKGETFKYNHTKKRGICFDYSTVAAALLSDNGYPPLILILRDGPFEGHAVFLYRNDFGFRALGQTPMPSRYEEFSGINGLKYYNSVNHLARSLNEEYGVHFTQFYIVNLDENIPHRGG